MKDEVCDVVRLSYGGNVNDYEAEFSKSLVNTDESSEEMDKLAYIRSHAIESVKAGGCVLIPIGRLGIVLQLLEQISLSLESSNLKVPILIVSTVAKEVGLYKCCARMGMQATSRKAIFL